VKVEIVTDESGFRSLKPIWNSLLQRSGADTVFLTFEWLSTWWRHFGPGNEMRIVLVRDQQHIVGIAPLMIRRRDGFRQFAGIGARTADYKDFIIANDIDEAPVVKAIFGGINSSRDWDFVRLEGLREDVYSLTGKLSSCVPKHLQPNWIKAEVCPYISIDKPWDAYWNSLGGRLRNDSQRKLRMLNREQGPVTFVHASHGADVDHYLSKLIALHLIRRKEVTKTYSVFEDTRAVAFYNDLAEELSALGWLRLSALLVGGEVAAVHLGFEYGGTFSYYMPTFDDSFSRYFVGRSLLLEMIRDAFVRRLKEFDLLLGDESYKFDFQPKIREVYSLSFCQGGLKGYLAHTWFGRVRPRLEAAVNLDTPLQQLKWWLRRSNAQEQ